MSFRFSIRLFFYCCMNFYVVCMWRNRLYLVIDLLNNGLVLISADFMNVLLLWVQISIFWYFSGKSDWSKASKFHGVEEDKFIFCGLGLFFDVSVFGWQKKTKPSIFCYHSLYCCLYRCGGFFMWRNAFVVFFRVCLLIWNHV